MAVCEVCFRHCVIDEGKTGFCGARMCRGGEITAANYGILSSLALDPIEKKPLRRFRPGEMILSVGSYGCNLRCPFCQNSSISWSDEALAEVQKVLRVTYGSTDGSTGSTAAAGRSLSARRRFKKYFADRTEEAGPAEDPEIAAQKLADLSLQYTDAGNMGVAFTYNEPLVGYEFVRDTAKLVHENGQVNVMVTNGTARLPVLEELLPYIDAMNIDLKGFTDRYYRDVLDGDRQMVMDFIARAAKDCHVELTTLIIPGENDAEEEMREMTRWIASLDPEIPLHISRFFPQFHMTDRPPTDVDQIYRLAEVAREQLRYVYTGNC